MDNPGAAIKVLRERAGLTAREAAALAGVSESYLSRVENGLVTPTNPWLGNVTSVLSDALIAHKKHAKEAA